MTCKKLKTVLELYGISRRESQQILNLKTIHQYARLNPLNRKEVAVMKKILCVTIFFIVITPVISDGDHDYNRYIHDYYKYGNFWMDHLLYGPQYNRIIPIPGYLCLPYNDKYLRKYYKYWNRYYEHPLYGPQYNRGMEGPVRSDYISPYYPLIPYEREENFYDWYRQNPNAVKKWTDEEIKKYNQEIDEARKKEYLE
jgi:hypothetical protein